MEKTVPFSNESEMAVLGSLIIDSKNESRPIVLEMLSSDHFYCMQHQLIYQSIESILCRQNALDLVLLRDELKGSGHLVEVGDVDYLVQLTNSTPSAANIKYYAQIVHDKYLFRQIFAKCSKFSEMACSNEGDAAKLLEEIRSQMEAVSSEAIQDDSGSFIGQEAIELGEEIINRKHGVCNGLSTGFIDLDNATGGLHPGEMIVIAARPSIGKTSLAMNIVENVACSGTPVAIFSLEMSKKTLQERMIVGMAGVDSFAAKSGYLNQEQKTAIEEHAYHLSKAPILIFEASIVTPTGISFKAKRCKSKHNIGLVVIDYLQLVHIPGMTSKVQEVTAISRQIKLLAMALDVPVIVMSQLNRQVEHREDRHPRLSDLRESGAIEQDADVVMFLHREDYYHLNDEKYLPTNIADLTIGKQRNGPTTSISLVWDGRRTRFENLAKDELQI